jgi:hypothetical protein
MMNSTGQWVRFKIRDIYYPDPTQVLVDLHGDDLLEGKVLDRSDSGIRKDAFAVVQVEGIAEPVIVPAERIVGTC